MLAWLDGGLFDPAGHPQPGYGGLDKYLRKHRDLAAAARLRHAAHTVG